MVCQIAPGHVGLGRFRSPNMQRIKLSVDLAAAAVVGIALDASGYVEQTLFKDLGIEK